jgi:HD-GYP domain-containing protein (c-di-GMP phosphodiesterase class II)
MITKIKAKELKVGMYVVMEQGWLKHPFLMNSFLISSKKQLEKFAEYGIEEVEIDTSRSQASMDVQTITHPPAVAEPPGQWDSNRGITKDLKKAIEDKSMPPEQKAVTVYKHSQQVMNKLFVEPTAEAIGASKEAIGNVADLIIADDETALNLLKITTHDFYTYTHSVNVGVLGISLAKRLYGNSNDHDMREMGAGFFLHDLGKVRVDPAILNKPARLDDDEMNKMRIHPYQSFRILEESSHLSVECRVIAMQHHEREDGTGYPRRLMGNEIHDYGRICCIADIFDALTAERSYKKALTPFQALQIMKEQLLGHFHKEIFENFVLLFGEEKRNVGNSATALSGSAQKWAGEPKQQ